MAMVALVKPSLPEQGLDNFLGLLPVLLRVKLLSTQEPALAIEQQQTVFQDGEPPVGEDPGLEVVLRTEESVRPAESGQITHVGVQLLGSVRNLVEPEREARARDAAIGDAVEVSPAARSPSQPTPSRPRR